ncbi:MAG: hypothetical protein R2751_00950 [Bacteroidales bacterium]
MKRIFTLAATFAFTGLLFVSQLAAQAPGKMSYQAVVRDSDDDLVVESNVGMRISILEGSVSGTAVYVETQTPQTNANGLVSLEIGAGTVVTGSFADIDWSAGPYFIKTETDPNGGTSYSITGTSQFLSVPYALHANTVQEQTYLSTTREETVAFASTTLPGNTPVTVLTLGNVPAGTYAVHFSCPIRNTSTSSLGVNLAFGVKVSGESLEFPKDGIASAFIPATGWAASYVFAQSGFKLVTLDADGTLELAITYWGNILSGNVQTDGERTLTAIRLK